MAENVIKGSAIKAEDGTFIFTPYTQGKPENRNWLILLDQEMNSVASKIDCSKKKVRFTLTMNRADSSVVINEFLKAFGRLTGSFNSAAVQKMYKAAAEMMPCEIESVDNKEPITFP